jgi:nucleoside-diphosphate-sugar epimerase
MTKKIALVTGATGYIGSNLVRYLSKNNWIVHIVVRPANSARNFEMCAQNFVTYHMHDGTTKGMVDIVRDCSPSFVFHIASMFVVNHRTSDIEGLINSNLLFGTQLIQAMVANGTRYLINCGSSWQHYNTKNYSPVNLYAATKQAFEDIILFYTSTNQVSVVTLVIFDTYGPGDSRGKIVELLIKCALNGRQLDLSPGNQYIDLVHIDDIVKAFEFSAKLDMFKDGENLRYGLTSGSPVKLRDLVVEIEKVVGCQMYVNWGARPYRQREVMMPLNCYNELVGWKAVIGIRDGLLDCYKYITNL